ncbi:iron-containing alcohol dehydrogenase [Vallitalea okinawensis]|uniref:iron-containing alcohol dehydrogenase n=1 Tax=Vallitalea okinawensis TaxID=2078660 RepID=UPI000CFB903A|nr:iron-containing alcohol dehydrogenase [Vallitalea okinawensis]
MIKFNLDGIPQTFFEEGALEQIKEIDLVKKSKKIILVIGKASFKACRHYDGVRYQLNDKEVIEVTIANEPSPHNIDEVVLLNHKNNIDLVIAIGGGSVLDAGKAISAMLPLGDSVENYLEGIGHKIHQGIKIPFIAVPTTSGTGSEATKNTVISSVGEKGFKKSLRHENFIPDIAILDPLLTLGCPKSVSAASGLDALSQLIESYLSTKGNPLTDSLALSGIKEISEALVPVCTNRSQDIELRSKVMYGAFLSGITLAHAGLGVVHGIAGPLGGIFPIPHGVACGRLLPEVMKITLEKVMRIDDQQTLIKFKSIAEALSVEEIKDISNCLANWVEVLNIPRLRDYGINQEDFNKIISISSNKNNPIDLTKEDKLSILNNCL